MEQVSVMEPTYLVFLRKCHYIHFKNENTKKLYSIFVFKSFFFIMKMKTKYKYKVKQVFSGGSHEN